MPKINQAKLYSTQISLSEWFEGIKHQDSEKLRLEDNNKRERLSVLNQIISLPFDKQVIFQATDITENTPSFQEYLKTHGSELCALRLVPTDPKLPKLRLRGVTISDSLTWFAEQKIDPQLYRAEFIPHSDNQTWSTIFIVNQSGIFGEIIKGGHYQLTQGFYDEGEPVSFYYNFKSWTFSQPNLDIESYVKTLITKIRVKDIQKRKALNEKLDAKFTNYYLHGYFETVDTSDFGLWFVDYNRLLGNLYSYQQINPTDHSILKGGIGSPGKSTGKVKIILSKDIKDQSLANGEILVCDMTTPDFISLMRQSAGIITDFGGILSHAAIVARELKIPCITGTKNATSILKDGDLIELNADEGVIKYAND